MKDRIYLSPPHMSGEEIELIQQAFADNWIAPVGPALNNFEQQFSDYTGAKHALAVSSGTAALHLALLTCGIQAGDEVFVSTLTFIASVNPILYLGAIPVFIDSDSLSWNMDADLLEEALHERSKIGQLPKAVIVVHLLGQSADIERIVTICQRYGVLLIEDAAESLGSRYKDKHPGTFGDAGFFSFNGNKIITTSGGGMLVSNNADLIAHARKLSTQARESTRHYEHREIGYNYRMSNILAAIGCGQLKVLDERVRRKRAIYERYRQALGDIPGLLFVEEMPYAYHSRWLSVVLVDKAQLGVDRDTICRKLEEHNIESRPMWKPMHHQPVLQEYESIMGEVADGLFEQGLCLPSGTALTDSQLDDIIAIIKQILE